MWGAGSLPVVSAPAAPDPAEIHRVLLAEQPTGAGEPELVAEQLVLHTGSGIYHRRAEHNHMRTVCGWGFADSSQAVGVPDRGAGPQGWFQLCGRCWPRARAEAKARSEPLAF